MLVEICDEKLSNIDLAYWLSLSMLPMLSNLCINLYNILEYKSRTPVATKESLMAYHYIFDLDYEEVVNLGLLSTCLCYLVYIICLCVLGNELYGSHLWHPYYRAELFCCFST